GQGRCSTSAIRAHDLTSTRAAVNRHSPAPFDGVSSCPKSRALSTSLWATSIATRPPTRNSMTMTTTRIGFGVVLLLCSALSFAEEAPAPTTPPRPTNPPNATVDSTLDRDIQIARSLTEASRQATVVANLPLTSAQANAFWPVYRQYRADVAVQND